MVRASRANVAVSQPSSGLGLNTARPESTRLTYNLYSLIHNRNPYADVYECFAAHGTGGWKRMHAYASAADGAGKSCDDVLPRALFTQHLHILAHRAPCVRCTARQNPITGM